MKNSHPFKRSHVLASLVALSAMISTSVFASGYAIKEVSASLLGNAFAGASTSNEDLSSMHFNPATISLMETNGFYVTGTGIFPHFDAKNIEATYPGSGLPVSGPNESNNNAPNQIVPAAYFGWNMSDDVKLAIAATVPYGLSTEYGDDWAGRLYGVDTDVESANINPVLSYNITKEWAVAAGFEAQYIKAKLTQFNGMGPGYEAYSTVEGHDWGYGYNIGTIYQATPELRVGVGYQSPIAHTLHGTTDVEYSSALQGLGYMNQSGLNANAGLQTPQGSMPSVLATVLIQHGLSVLVRLTIKAPYLVAPVIQAFPIATAFGVAWVPAITLLNVCALT